ncbi:hypothetical protein KCTC52924_00731 [Arenibacter antarcticus]|uniref:Uncharacterized protein n=1 Tax=Arenibacter antarcticus TaxID=2040469 RepID=A0ABW5VD07_9FLAO|nr:hypothetical protein [Arenibacter sp. H213]MCM4169207.1 hypothetical protein [Arenibacter sp. H213]
MNLTKICITLFLSIGFISCSDDDTLIDNEQRLKSFELINIQWKLNLTDGQSIVEEKIPELHFRNDSETPMEVVIEPLKDVQGSSLFRFNDSIAFSKLNYEEVQVSITKELSLLSERYSYLVGGVEVPLTQEETYFPFSYYFENALMLNPRSTLTSNYTVFLRKNKASFLATFREINNGEILELDGTWTGLFFNNLTGESVVDNID